VTTDDFKNFIERVAINRGEMKIVEEEDEIIYLARDRLSAEHNAMVEFTDRGRNRVAKLTEAGWAITQQKYFRPFFAGKPAKHSSF